MALLLRPLEISSITRREAPMRTICRIIRSRKNDSISLCSVKELDMVVLRMREGYDGLYRVVKERETVPFKGESKEQKKKPEYYVNTGYAIRTLREEMPELFYRELSFDIYRDDIVFKDPINVFAGIGNYKSLMWSLRFHGRIFFRALWINTVSVWQPAENTIMIHWIIHGIPRTPWESRSRFDGTSEYRLDRDGKIYEHKVDYIAPNGPRNFQILAMEQLHQTIIYRSSTPNPT